MMVKRKILLVLGLMLALGVSPSANAATTLILNTFADQTAGDINNNPVAANYLMASVGTSSQGGGAASDALTTTVSFLGSVAAADIAEVCVDYGGATPDCQAVGSLTGIVINLTGTETGDLPFNYRVTLNSSA